MWVTTLGITSVLARKQSPLTIVHALFLSLQSHSSFCVFSRSTVVLTFTSLLPDFLEAFFTQLICFYSAIPLSSPPSWWCQTLSRLTEPREKWRWKIVSLHCDVRTNTQESWGFRILMYIHMPLTRPGKHLQSSILSFVNDYLDSWCSLISLDKRTAPLAWSDFSYASLLAPSKL